MLTDRELEALLRIDVKRIYSYVEGPIPYVRIQSNLQFVRSQIFDCITEHNRQPASPLTRRLRRLSSTPRRKTLERETRVVAKAESYAPHPNILSVYSPFLERIRKIL